MLKPLESINLIQTIVYYFIMKESLVFKKIERMRRLRLANRNADYLQREKKYLNKCIKLYLFVNFHNGKMDE